MNNAGRHDESRVNTPALSVVIPTVNEAGVIERLTSALFGQSLSLEVIVCDGGSSDATPRLAREAGARLVSCPRGRGTQMNAGAGAAKAETLLFLHADSELLDGPEMLESALESFRQLASESNVQCAGHFPLKFLRDDPGRDAFYRYMEAKSRSNRPGTINGDQGLLISRSCFEALGGFDESLPIFEDQRLSAKIFSSGKWVLLPGRLGTSARRFEREGHFERYLLMALMMAMHETGLPDFLARARNVYSEQSDTQDLEFAPFAALARKMLLSELRNRPRFAAAVGRYLRSNGWQLGLMLDLYLNSGAEPQWTDRLDRFCTTRLGTVTDAAVGLVGASLVLGAIPLAENLRRRLRNQ